MITDEERARRLVGANKRARASADRVGAMPGPERYELRKSLYQPGSVCAVALDSAFGGVDGMWGVVVVHSCSWIGNLYYYLMNVWLDELPSPNELSGLVTPDLVLELWNTGDSMLCSGEFVHLGVLDGVGDADWPAPVEMWTNETRGPTVARYKARRLLPLPVASPEVAGFVMGAVPRPWLEVNNIGYGSFPITRLSGWQHFLASGLEYEHYSTSWRMEA